MLKKYGADIMITPYNYDMFNIAKHALIVNLPLVDKKAASK